jgi:5-formyltetrahydrofolate cyclo-ligase
VAPIADPLIGEASGQTSARGGEVRTDAAMARATGGMDKQALREQVWRILETRRIARFPGARGRIPNFVGAERAAERLATLAAWKKARVLKVNPDAPQIPVRRRALDEGKVLYMAVPRLTDQRCFIELDPARLGKRAARAGTIKGAVALGRPVKIGDMRHLDLIVCGSVAVNRCGERVGKGGGYSDLEFGLLRAAGAVGSATPVVTTVHLLQIVDERIEMLPHDIPLDWIVTPDHAYRCSRRHAKPAGVYWDYLTEEKVAAIPVLRRLRPNPAGSTVA